MAELDNVCLHREMLVEEENVGRRADRLKRWGQEGPE